jgi:hypothetical protein
MTLLHLPHVHVDLAGEVKIYKYLALITSKSFVQFFIRSKAIIA